MGTIPALSDSTLDTKRVCVCVCVCVRARARACVYSTNHCFYPYHLRPPAKSQEARADDVSVNELASYLETLLNLPQPMSYMASLMYN